MSRYDRQILLPQIGQAGQARLAGAQVLLIGCGALGTVIAEQLVRKVRDALCNDHARQGRDVAIIDRFATLDIINAPGTPPVLKPS